MCLYYVLPGCTVEELLIVIPRRVTEMDSEVFLSLINLGSCDYWPTKVLFQIILQAEEANIGVCTATALEIGINCFCSRRILKVMGHFV